MVVTNTVGHEKGEIAFAIGDTALQGYTVLQRATGVNYYTYVSPAGTSIKKSVDWLLPYLTGEKTHGEFVNSTVEFDRQRARNGEAAYKAGTLFDPKNGVPTLLLASYFDTDPELMPLARKLSGTEDRYPGWRAVVNAVMVKLSSH
jgi:hypothetical protein